MPHLMYFITKQQYFGQRVKNYINLSLSKTLWHEGAYPEVVLPLAWAKRKLDFQELLFHYKLLEGSMLFCSAEAGFWSRHQLNNYVAEIQKCLIEAKFRISALEDLWTQQKGKIFSCMIVSVIDFLGVWFGYIQFKQTLQLLLEELNHVWSEDGMKTIN